MSLSVIAGAVDGTQIPCGLSPTFPFIDPPIDTNKMSERLQSPRCVVYGPNPAVPTQSPLTVRIEQFGPLPNDINMNLFTHWFAL